MADKPKFNPNKPYSGVDNSAKPSFDPNKPFTAAEEDSDVAIEEPLPVKPVVNLSPSKDFLGRGTDETKLAGLGLPVMSDDLPTTGATPEKRVTVNTPFGQSSISADAPITKLGVEINKQVKRDGGEGYFDSFRPKQGAVEGSLVGDFSGSTAVKVQGKSGITGRINTQKNPDSGLLGDQGFVGATDKEVTDERERIVSQVYNDPSLREIVKVEKSGERLIDPSKLNSWFEKYQKDNGLEYLDANDKIYIRNKLYQSVADERGQEKILDAVKKTYAVEGKVDPITATDFVNELMPDIERQVSNKIVGELQWFADGLNEKVRSGAMTAEEASKKYDEFYTLQSATMYPKLMKERGDKLAEHYGLNEEAKKEFSKRYAEQAEKRALDENMGAYEFWKNQGWNSIGAGLTKGMGDVVKLAGDAMMNAGWEDLGQQISQTAKSQNLPDVQLPEFSAESLADPVWWSTKMIPTLPLMAEMIVPSLMTQGVTAGALSTMGVKGIANLLASGTAAGVTNRYIESIAEGAGQYGNDIEKGLSPDIAARHAADVTKKNMNLTGLDALQYSLLFAKIPPALKLAIEGGTEYGEEVYQGFVQMQQENPEMPFLKYATTPEGIEAGVLGGMMGLAFGGVGALGTQKQGSKYQKASVVYDMLSNVGENDQKRGLQMIATLDDLYRTGMMKEKDYKEALAITQSVLEQRNSLPDDLSEKARKEVVLYNFQVKELERQKENATREAIEYINRKIAAIPPPAYTDEEREQENEKIRQAKADVDTEIKSQASKLRSDVSKSVSEIKDDARAELLKSKERLGLPLSEPAREKTEGEVWSDIPKELSREERLKQEAMEGGVVSDVPSVENQPIETEEAITKESPIIEQPSLETAIKQEEQEEIKVSDDKYKNIPSQKLEYKDGTAFVHKDIEGGKEHLYISRIDVSDKSKGTGSEFLTKIEEYAKEQGLNDVIAIPETEASKRFFEKNGYVEKDGVVYKTISKAPKEPISEQVTVKEEPIISPKPQTNEQEKGKEEGLLEPKAESEVKVEDASLSVKEAVNKVIETPKSVKNKLDGDDKLVAKQKKDLVEQVSDAVKSAGFSQEDISAIMKARDEIRKFRDLPTTNYKDKKELKDTVKDVKLKKEQAISNLRKDGFNVSDDGKIKFEIIDDGSVTIDYLSLPATLDAILKQFPSSSKVDVSVKIPPSILTSSKRPSLNYNLAETVKEAEDEVSIAKENLQTAKKSGNKKLIEYFTEVLGATDFRLKELKEKAESTDEAELNEVIKEADDLISGEKPIVKENEVPKTIEQQGTEADVQKYKIGKSPQTYTLLEKLQQTKDEKELGEQPVKVRNDKTGEEQIVLETDLTKVKSRLASAKDALAQAKAKAKQVYDEEGLSGIASDPYRSAKRKAEADREVFNAYVDLAKEHIKAGVKKISDFAKSIGEEISETVKNAWANANKELPESQLKTAVAIVKNSIKGGLTKEQAIADAAKYIESTRWFEKFGSKEQSDNMTNHIAEHLSTLNDKDLEALSTKDFRKVFSNLSKSISDIASEKDFTEAKAKVADNLVNYIKTNSQRFSDFDKRYFNAVLDNVKRAKTPISLGREVAKFNRSLKDFGFRDLYRKAADMRRKAKKNATKDKFGGITPDIRKFLSIDPREIPIEELDRYIGHLEDISARAREVNARIADIRDFNVMMQGILDQQTVTEETPEKKVEDAKFRKQVIAEVSKALKSDTFDTSNLIPDELELVNRIRQLTDADLDRLTLPQLQQLATIANKLENGWLSNRVKLDILDKIDTQKQTEKIQKVSPNIFRSMDEVSGTIPDSKVKETITAKQFFDSMRKTSLNYIDEVLRAANKIFYTNFVYPFEQGFTQVKLKDGKIQNELKDIIRNKLKLPFFENILHGKKFREMNTKLSFYAKNLDWKANGGEGDLTKILLYGKDKNGNDHLRNANISAEDKIYLREQYEALSKKYADKNGELDLEKMKADMSLGERILLDYVKTKFETDIKPKLYFSETYNRGGVFIPQDEYNPRKVLDERVTAPTADDMVSKMVDPETAKTTSSKASSTIERNQAVRFQSFDFVGDFIETAHDAYVDYYISPIAKKVFSGLTELEKTASNKDIGKIQGLKRLLKDSLLNIINTNYEKLSVPEKAINMGARIAINNMLTNLPRIFAEPASNFVGAATTVGLDYMARGMYQYTSDRKFWNDLMHEANTPILNRVGRYTAEVSPVFENEIYIPNHTTKGISEKLGKVLDVLDKNEISEISKHVAAETLKFGDAVTIIPTWTAAYIKSVEKQTGKPFSKDTDYDKDTKQEAFAYADNIASQTHNVSSSFAQSRVIRESRQTFVKAVSWFLRGFILNDITNFVYKGKAFLNGKSPDVSRAQAAQAMAGIIAKQVLYAGIMKSVGGVVMYAGISNVIGSLSGDDEEKKKVRDENEAKMMEDAKEVFTPEGIAKNAAMNLLQLFTGKMNFIPMVLANNIAENINKAVTGSSYDAYKDAITYSPDITGKVLDGKINNIGFYDIKRMLGAYGVVADRMGLTVQEINRITAKVAGDETLTEDELIKWKTMNAMFFNLQALVSFPFSGTIQRTIQNEQRIQDGKVDEYRDAKVKYLEYKDLSRDKLNETLLKDKAAAVDSVKKKSKSKDMALVREFKAAEDEVDKIGVVAEREARKLYSKEEKMISNMGVEKPNDEGYVMDYIQKKTKNMTPKQKKEYLDDLYEKYIISRDTKESLKILTK